MFLISGAYQKSSNSQGAGALPKKGLTIPLTSEEVMYSNLGHQIFNSVAS